MILNKSDALTIRLFMRLPHWRKEKIRRAAELAGQSMSEYILIAVDRRINHEREQESRKQP
jgi:uncharacterized protein (DUF1778 family)